MKEEKIIELKLHNPKREKQPICMIREFVTDQLKMKVTMINYDDTKKDRVSIRIECIKD